MFIRTMLLLLFLISGIFAQNKITIAVMDLDAEGISASENRIISNRLRTELIETKKYTVVEREKVEEILNEQGFQLSGCTSNECAIQAGKLIGVKYMAVGSIGKIGGIFTINIRLINVETGIVIKTAVEDCKGSIDMVVTEAVKRTAEKLAGIKTTIKSKPKQEKLKYAPPPTSQAKRSPVYRPAVKKTKKPGFYIGIGYGNGRYTLASPLGLRSDVGVPFKFTLELSLGLRIIYDLWLGYALKSHTFNEVWSGDRYEGELLIHYPKIQYYVWKWVYLSYGYGFKELNFKKTSTVLPDALSKKFFNDDSMNIFSLGSTMKMGQAFAMNIELSYAENYFTAGYDIYFIW